MAELTEWQWESVWCNQQDKSQAEAASGANTKTTERSAGNSLAILRMTECYSTPRNFSTCPRNDFNDDLSPGLRQRGVMNYCRRDNSYPTGRASSILIIKVL
ncbi:MAG: hypothetical protein DMG30_09885 [Acidobacteria bacterium]|nr:MAG: hypothetical protein DMG30_09885 [Acidobacteriota bacterium]